MHQSVEPAADDDVKYSMALARVTECKATHKGNAGSMLPKREARPQWAWPREVEMGESRKPARLLTRCRRVSLPLNVPELMSHRSSLYVVFVDRGYGQNCGQNWCEEG